MPYENTPTENAPALAPRVDEYQFTFDIEGYHPDGELRASIDDLDLFSQENQTTNKQMLDFLDRVVTKVVLRGEVLTSRIVTKDDEGNITNITDRTEGVRGKKIPMAALIQLMQGVGQAMQRANNPKN